MIVSAERIRALVHDHAINPRDRLIITPVLDWDNQAKEGNCSIDVRLGQKFRIPRRTKLSHLDHLADDHQESIALYRDDHYVYLGDHFVLHPQQFVLGETLEWVHLPSGYAAYVIGRSSWGRDGLIIATATGVHSRFSGVLTLEITNVGEIPIFLYPGLTIAQLFIHTVDHTQSGVDAMPSTYSGSTAPSAGNAAGHDAAMILRFRERLVKPNWARRSTD